MKINNGYVSRNDIYQDTYHDVLQDIISIDIGISLNPDTKNDFFKAIMEFKNYTIKNNLTNLCEYK